MLFSKAAAYVGLTYLFGKEKHHQSFQAGLSAENKKKRDRRLLWCSIKTYNESPFQYLYESGDDQALLNITGCTHKVFLGLLKRFEPCFHTYRPNMETGRVERQAYGPNGSKIGQPRCIDTKGCLALVLLWYRTRGAMSRGLAIMFGLTHSTMCIWLKFGRRLLLHTLQDDPYSGVSLPTEEDIKLYEGAIAGKYPVLEEKKVWAAADSLKLAIEASGNDCTQNQFYNGWVHGHFVNSVFVFAPDGRIRIATINAPGAWHDSTIADYGVYKQMDQIYKEHNGASVVVDSAFGLGERDCLVKSAQIDPVGHLKLVSINRAATSVRQLSEWGVCMLQAQFSRLKDPLPYEEFGERRIILHLMVLLYNFNCSYIGVNQILNSYLDKDVNQDSDVNYYDRNHSLEDSANKFVKSFM